MSQELEGGMEGLWEDLQYSLVYLQLVYVSNSVSQSVYENISSQPIYGFSMQVIRSCNQACG